VAGGLPRMSTAYSYISGDPMLSGYYQVVNIGTYSGKVILDQGDKSVVVFSVEVQ